MTTKTKLGLQAQCPPLCESIHGTMARLRLGDARLPVRPESSSSGRPKVLNEIDPAELNAVFAAAEALDTKPVSYFSNAVDVQHKNTMTGKVTMTDGKMVGELPARSRLGVHRPNGSDHGADRKDSHHSP